IDRLVQPPDDMLVLLWGEHTGEEQDDGRVLAFLRFNQRRRIFDQDGHSTMMDDFRAKLAREGSDGVDYPGILDLGDDPLTRRRVPVCPLQADPEINSQVSGEFAWRQLQPIPLLV